MSAICARFAHDERQSFVEAAFTGTSHGDTKTRRSKFYLRVLRASVVRNYGDRRSHAVVLRSPTILGRDPGDHLVGIHDVAGLAVDAVRCIDLQTRRAVGVMLNLIDV